jgi:hypothetical protein
MLVIAALATPALAQPPTKKQKAEAAYKEGQGLYMKEDFTGAAAKFKEAHDHDPDPVYLYNVAQAHRLAKKCVDAGEYYRRYLRDAKKAPNEDAVKQYLSEVDDCARAAGQKPFEFPDKPVEPPKEEVTAQSGPPIETPQQRDTDTGGGTNVKRIMSYVAFGVGAVGIGGGILFAKRVSDAEKDAANICPNMMCPDGMWDSGMGGEEEQRKKIDSRGERAEKLMIGSFALAGAAVATGVVLFIISGDEPKHESSVTVAPTKNGAVVSLTF